MTDLATEKWWFSVGDDGRDPRLGCFASGGELDGALPSARTLGLLECLAVPYGPEDRPFAGATRDEAAGILAAAAATESHAAGLKLAAVREIIRRHAPATADGTFPDPGTWRLDVLHEVAAILRISVQSADPVVHLAWQLEARLPGTGDLLNCGVLSYLTAKIIADEFSVLDDEKAAEAEQRLLEHDLSADDMTPGKIRRLCQRIADTVDPAGAAERRERKQRDEARVRYYRDHGGAGSLFATGLPPDDALRSETNVQKRALEYKKAGIKEKMDFLRVLALVDLTNGTGIPGRLALWRAGQAERQRNGPDDPGQRAWAQEQADNAARDRYGDRPPFPDEEPSDLADRYPSDERPDEPRSDDPPADERRRPGEDHLGNQDPDAPPFPPGDSDATGESADGGDDLGGGNEGEGPGDGGGPAGGGPSGGVGGSVPAGTPDPGLPALVNMTIPLSTVLGQADRPGEAPGYGSLDPALAVKLANAAGWSPRSRFCVTFTDPEGHAAAHGCAKPIRITGRKRNKEKSGPDTGPPDDARDGPARTGWDFTHDPARPDRGHGSWILTLPTGVRYRVDVHTIPLHECDHRYATSGYRPSDLLRHLVQVRDGECTFTGCSRSPQESDFEHAIPYHQGGATDACNAGVRSRSCHQVKQSPGWNVTQPEPGWHKWTTPSGRSYIKGPKIYPD